MVWGGCFYLTNDVYRSLVVFTLDKSLISRYLSQDWTREYYTDHPLTELRKLGIGEG